MPSELDRSYDAMLEAVTGPEGRIKVGRDADGRAIVTNLPPTLPIFFDAFCMLNGAVEAVVCGGERLTFAELNAHATRAAKGLVAGYGIAKGDRVAIAMRNAPGWIVAYMAVVKAGGVAVLINGWWQPHELKHALALTEPKLVIADSQRARRVADSGLSVETLTLPIERDIEQAMAPLLAKGEGAELPDVAPEDDATILFTSGSTGQVKGAVSTHRAVTTGVYAYSIGLATLLGLKEKAGTPPANPPRTLINVPLFHVTGEVPVLLNSFVVARGMVLMAKWDPGEALRLIEQEKITYFVGVPTMSLELMQHPDAATRDLSTLTDIAAGGAARPVDHVTRLQSAFTGAQPALGYGLTETNAVGCSNFWSSYAARPASTGRPQKPLVEVAILGQGDIHLAAGEAGEVAIRSHANCRGYWRDEAATRAAFTADGFFRTGDIGYLDEEDYLFIVDRKKDIIIRGGENIATQELEAEIYGHPAVSEACVFGLPDERLGEVPGAIFYSESGAIDAAGLRAFLDARIAAFKVPAHIWRLDEPLPKLGTGKIDKVSLRNLYHEVAAKG